MQLHILLLFLVGTDSVGQPAVTPAKVSISKPAPADTAAPARLPRPVDEVPDELRVFSPGQWNEPLRKYPRQEAQQAYTPGDWLTLAPLTPRREPVIIVPEEPSTKLEVKIPENTRKTMSHSSFEKMLNAKVRAKVYNLPEEVQGPPEAMAEPRVAPTPGSTPEPESLVEPEVKQAPVVPASPGTSLPSNNNKQPVNPSPAPDVERRTEPINPSPSPFVPRQTKPLDAPKTILINEPQFAPPKDLTNAIKALMSASAPSSPKIEFQAAAKDLATTVSEPNRQFTRYLTFYALPPERRHAAMSAVSFWLNSLSKITDITQPTKIQVEGTYLLRIDLRNYQIDPAQWEKLALKDTYLQEPWIPHEDAGYIRDIAGNAVLRGDWFLFMTSDVTEDSAYYDLLYDGKPPKSAVEFANFWGVDFDRVVRQFRTDRGITVEEGNSIVSLHNRVLWRLRTVLGAYWATFDVAESVGDRDYVEHLFPGEKGSKFDAQEHIVTMPNGLQAYLLSNAEGAAVDFADPALVRDSTDPHGDARVRTPVSCVRCHIHGINPPISLNLAFAKRRINLKVIDPTLARRIDSFFFTPIEPQIEEDQGRYAQSVQMANNMTAAENAAAFRDTISWYEDKLDLRQAAIECGIPPEQLAEAIKASPRGRLQDLAFGGKVPRKTWEKQLFPQAMLLIEGLQR